MTSRYAVTGPVVPAEIPIRKTDGTGFTKLIRQPGTEPPRYRWADDALHPIAKSVDPAMLLDPKADKKRAKADAKRAKKEIKARVKAAAVQRAAAEDAAERRREHIHRDRITTAPNPVEKQEPPLGINEQMRRGGEIAKAYDASTIKKPRKPSHSRKPRDPNEFDDVSGERDSPQAPLAGTVRGKLWKTSKSLDMVQVAKSLLSRGPGAQPGITNRDFYRAIDQMAADAYAGNAYPGKSRPQIFAMLIERDPDCTTLYKAMSRATQAPWDDAGDDSEDGETLSSQQNADSLTAYQRLCDVAEGRKKTGQTLAQAFAELFEDPDYLDLVNASKQEFADRVRVAKSPGTLTPAEVTGVDFDGTVRKAVGPRR